MPDYGVTDKGFVPKRLDTILEEIHSDLTDGFGVDTRLNDTSFLNVLVTTFGGQIADLWEIAQDSYYAKYPSTATGLSLDHAVQYGGIRRQPDSRSRYPLHCTGDDGTIVREKAYVATDTSPEIRLYSAGSFTISRKAFNRVSIRVAVFQQEGTYSVSINGKQYSYVSSGQDREKEILDGLKESITADGYETAVDAENLTLSITDTNQSRSSKLVLSDNLTTSSVTTIANFYTEDYGRITLPDGIVSKIINNIPGFLSVNNMLAPVYGRIEETDVESYLAKSAIRSTGMIGSITSHLLNDIEGVESATGYENEKDVTDSEGRPPHSIEIVVEGGSDFDVAAAIFERKTGGIYTYGSVEINVPDGENQIPVRFNRPDYVYAWAKITLYGDSGKIDSDYKNMVIEAVMDYCGGLIAGDDLLSQKILEGIYDTVNGVNYVDISLAASDSEGDAPDQEEYTLKNIMASSRQKIIFSSARIEVAYGGNLQ